MCFIVDVCDILLLKMLFRTEYFMTVFALCPMVVVAVMLIL